MNNLKKIFLLTVCVFFFTLQNANAGVIADALGSTVYYTTKSVFVVTKYTFKTGWFITKTTAKGLKIVSANAFKGAKSAFISKPKVKAKPTVRAKPITKPATTQKYHYNKLPPPPPVLNWVD